MLKPYLTCLTLVLAVPLCAQSAPPTAKAQAIDTHALKAQFQKEHNRLSKAFDKKDLDSFMAHYTPDMTYKELTGATKDFAALRDFMKSLIASVEKVHEHVHKVVSVTAGKDEVKARITEHWSFDIIDRIPMFGTKDAPHKISGKEAYDETWVKVGDAWKVKNTQEISEDILVDGKPAK